MNREAGIIIYEIEKKCIVEKLWIYLLTNVYYDMRVLWIAPNGGNYKKGVVKGTGGWIGALQEELSKSDPDLELGIAFVSSTDNDVIHDGKVTYLPIKKTIPSGGIKGLFYGFLANKEKEDAVLANQIKRCIDKYKPDIIHVWGIENDYASVIKLIDRPFVVHIQGLLSLYIYIYLPYGFSRHDLFKADFPLRWLLRAGNMRDYNMAKYRAQRELAMGKYVKNWIGRTDWDHTMSQMLSPDSRYFHCEEMMRGDFNDARWEYHYDGNTIHIHSSLSAEWYKGIDIVLKTAIVMKESGINVEWNVYGVERGNYRLKYFIKKLKIIPEEVNVYFRGRVDGKAIRDGLLSSDVFVHPSYIENSSNAIAEAMMLGVPVVANNVGGNASMLREDSGVLVAPNEPYIMAAQIVEMTERTVAEGYSNRSLAVARERQNTGKIINTLVSIYREVAE